MSLKFYLGSAGAGKSHKLHEDICKRAERERDKNFLFIVPDQYTMQTQRDLVMASGSRGIMNIDVLSFSRLAHRIFEELGEDKRLVLDDTGKNLILKKLAAELKESLPVLGENLNKQGYIHEIKSVISEFKQYDISSEKLDGLIAFSKGRGMLSMKLSDIGIIYDEFNKYIKDRFITTEETMTLLTEVLDKSGIIKGAVVVFDGFTGFTPVQYRLIRRLLELTDQVIVSVTVDAASEPYKIKGEQELFYLSKKTVLDLQTLAMETNTPLDEDVLLEENFRFKGNRVLGHLERSIFRYPVKKYEQKADGISINYAPDIETEIRNVCIRIKQLALYEGIKYRDMAIVCGDLNAYADELKLYADMYELPLFIDMTRGIKLNPFIELIRSALRVCRDNFSYDALFHFLRSGFTGIPNEDIDILDNYVLACGIRGIKAYRESFTRLPGQKRGDEISDEAVYGLQRLNNIRNKIIDILSPLLERKKTAGEYSDALMLFLERNGAEKRLDELTAEFENNGDKERAREYAQIYGLVTELLIKIRELIPDERVSADEFAALLDAGFDEIDVGTLPGGTDRIIAGDIERSRISQIRILFFVGVNDGNIPRANSKGGLISDIDREFLKGADIPLSPTPREQIYIQRLYLYMNMTKPSERLYISYSLRDKAGKMLKPSYLVPVLLRLFPELKETPFSETGVFDGIMGEKDALAAFSDGIREWFGHGKSELKDSELTALFLALTESEAAKEAALRLLYGAGFEYKESPVSKELAKALYGNIIKNSVSRLENYASCAYAHFLKYALKLSEREEFRFERRDLGNIYHETLCIFANKINESGYTLWDFPDKEGERILAEALNSVSSRYGEVVLYSSAKNEYTVKRIYDTLKSSISAMRIQLKSGDFKPVLFEQGFSETIKLSGNNSLRLIGRIDRIDVYENDGKLFVKIVDFKTGNKDIELDRLYYGLQLQMPLYMSAALKAMGDKAPAEGAAMLYFHIDDPIVGEDVIPDDEKRSDELLMELMPKGLLINDKELLFHFDRGLKNPLYRSKVVPVKTNRDMSISANSSVIGREDFKLLGDYVLKLAADMGDEILNGRMAVNPKKKGEYDSCTYCGYKDICLFDEKLPGFEKKELAGMESREAMEKIRECL